MSEQSEKMLADLNAAVQRVADESESEMVRNLVMFEQLPQDSMDFTFKGIVDLRARFYAAGAEIKMNTEPNENRLHNLIKIRIQDSLFAIIDLAQSELAKLGIKTEITH